MLLTLALSEMGRGELASERELMPDVLDESVPGFCSARAVSTWNNGRTDPGELTLLCIDGLSVNELEALGITCPVVSAPVVMI